MKLEFLQQYFDYDHGAPSDDTCRRFFRAVEPGEFEQRFRDWIAKLAKIDKPQVIAIDGKASRHSFDDEQKMMHMVNVFATESKIILGQNKVSEKTNEITARNSGMARCERAYCHHRCDGLPICDCG